MEKEEQERYLQQRHKKIVAAEAKLIQKQQNEMQALRKKIDSTMQARLKQREQEHNKLLQRYQNVKKELENEQNLERQRKEKFAGRPQTANRSTMSYNPSKKSIMKGSVQAKPQSKAPASKPSNY